MKLKVKFARDWRLGVKIRRLSDTVSISVFSDFCSHFFDFFELSGRSQSSKFKRRLRVRFGTERHVSSAKFVASGASVEELRGEAGGEGGS